MLVDEIEVEAQVKRNKIADIIMKEIAWWMNWLVNEEARRCCEGCEMDDPSQLHHECMLMDIEETVIEKEIFTKLDVYLLHLLKVDVTSAFLLYEHYKHQKNEGEDECLRLGCFDYM